MRVLGGLDDHVHQLRGKLTNKKKKDVANRLAGQRRQETGKDSECKYKTGFLGARVIDVVEQNAEMQGRRWGGAGRGRGRLATKTTDASQVSKAVTKPLTCQDLGPPVCSLDRPVGDVGTLTRTTQR